MDDYYRSWAAERRRKEQDTAASVAAAGTPDGDGWVSRELADGTVEWRPEDQGWAPAGYRWAIDPHDRYATGGPQFTTAEQRAGGSVPKLERIVSELTHPTREKRLWDEGQHRFVDEGGF